ncbi:hypothetical protein AAC387_Pa03g3122 [Persea americana]
MNPSPSESSSDIMRRRSSGEGEDPRAERTSQSSEEEILPSPLESKRLKTFSISSVGGEGRVWFESVGFWSVDMIRSKKKRGRDIFLWIFGVCAWIETGREGRWV